MKRLLDVLTEPAFLAVALLVFMGAVLPLIGNPTDTYTDTQASDPVLMRTQLVIYAIAALLMMRALGTVLVGVRGNVALCALLAMAVVSILWSDVATYSAGRVVALGIKTMMAVYIGTKYGVKDQVRIVGWALACAVIASIIFLVLFPAYGLDIGPNLGAWRGAFLQKNIFGRYMIFAAITLLCYPTEGRRAWLFKMPALCIVLGLLAGSQSAGSYTVAAVVLPLAYSLGFLSLPRKKLLSASVIGAEIAVAMTALLAFNRDAIFAILGRNASLTGRIPLWSHLFVKIAQRPIQGYGYRGFWPKWGPEIWAQMTWQPSKAHNGYIDLWLELGVIGLVLFGIFAVVGIQRCLKYAKADHEMSSRWPLLMLVTVLLYNTFESDMISQAGFPWLVFVLATVSVGHALKAEHVEEQDESFGFLQASEPQGVS